MSSLKRFQTCLSSRSVGYLECWSQFFLAFKNKLHNTKKLFWCFPLYLHVFDYCLVVSWWKVVYFNSFLKYNLGGKKQTKNPIKIVNSHRRNLRPTKGFLS